MSKPSWVSTNPTSGTGDSPVAVTASKNTGVQRSGSVNFAGSGVSKNVEVSQEADLAAQLLTWGSVFIKNEDSEIPQRQPGTSVGYCSFAGQGINYSGDISWTDDTENCELNPEVSNYPVRTEVLMELSFSQLFNSDLNGTYKVSFKIFNNTVGSGDPVATGEDTVTVIGDNQLNVQAINGITIPPLEPTEYNEIEIYIDVAIEKVLI